MTGAKKKRPLAGAGRKRRAEIGRERREKTRKLLLLSAAKLVALRGTEGVSIDDFVKAAGMARGTFYNYFQTREQLVDELWQLLGNPPFLSISKANLNEQDPACRLVNGFRWIIRKAAKDHIWGWLLFRITTAETDLNEQMRSFPLADIRAGIASGRFSAKNAEIVCDYLIGTGLMALKAVMVSERPPDYPEQCAYLILRGLGLKSRDARDVAQRPLPEIVF